MSEPEVTASDIDAANVLCGALGLSDDRAMVLAEFRACARWEALEHAERARSEAEGEQDAQFRYSTELDRDLDSLRTRLAEAEEEVLRLRDVEGLAWQTKVLKAEQRGRAAVEALEAIRAHLIADGPEIEDPNSPEALSALISHVYDLATSALAPSATP